MSAASTAAGLASNVAAYSAAGDEAEETAKENNRRYKKFTASARANYYRNLANIGERVSQERTATSDSATQIAIETARSQGTARALAAERGVTGKSVGLLLDDFERTAGSNYLTLGTNLNWLRRQAAEDSRGLHAETEDAIRQNRPVPIRGPSSSALAINLGSTLLSGAGNALNTYRQWKV